MRPERMFYWYLREKKKDYCKACDAPTISEENLQGVVMRAINEVLGSKSTVIEDMKAILETMDSGSTDTRLAEIEQELADIQQELITLATTNKDYDDLADKVISLREEKNALLTEKAEENGRVLMREDLMTFLDEQTAELTEYDEQLVRRLIENIIIRTDGTYKIEFKSGTTIEL